MEPAPLPLHKRILLSATAFFLFLVVMEGGLALLGPVSGWLQHGERNRIADGHRLVLCLGDSVTLGNGVPKDQSWPAQLQRWLADRGLGDGSGSGVQVVNRAPGGEKIQTLADREIPTLETLPARDAPIVLLLVGHNDLLGGGGGGGPLLASSNSGDSSGYSPRVWRLFRWSLGLVLHDRPKSEVAASDATLFAAQIARIRDAVARANGTLLLMTYLVPGSPGSDFDAQTSRSIAVARDHELAINALLRQTASQDGLILVDLERGVLVSGTWDPAVFRDSIHLTPEGYRQVAAAVGGWLLGSGVLDPAS